MLLEAIAKDCLSDLALDRPEWLVELEAGPLSSW